MAEEVRPEDLAQRLQPLVDARRWAEVDAVVAPVARAAAAGDGDALEALLYALDRCRLAHGAIWAVVSERAMVEDAAQDTIVAVSRGIGTFRGEARFTTWLHQVARHAAMATVARARRDPPAEDSAPDMTGTTRSLSSIVTDRLVVDGAIAALPPAFREVLVLREVEQLDYAEIGRRLGLPPGTVRSRIARARARLVVALRHR